MSTKNGELRLASCKKYRDGHKKELAIKAKEYYEGHKKELAIKIKKKKEEHPEIFSERRRKCLEKNPKIFSERHHKYYEGHKEELAIKTKQRREEHPEIFNKRHRKYREENPDNNKKYYEEHKEEIIAQTKKRIERMPLEDRELFREKKAALARKKREEHPEISSEQHRKKYGLKKGEYDKLILEQKGKCALCGENNTKKGKLIALGVDHDHKTGKIRALLCNRCNMMLGMIHDDVTLLPIIQKYLAKNNFMDKEIVEAKAARSIKDKEDKEGNLGCLKIQADLRRERQRENRLKKVYGISVAEYNKKLKEQGGKCAICAKETNKLKNKTINFNTDHNHETGEIRGLLCSSCNLTLTGFEKKLKADENFIQKMIDYLLKNK